MRFPSPASRSTLHAPRTVALLCALGVLAVRLPGAQAQGGTTSEFVPTFSTNTRVRQQADRLNRLAAQKLWDEWLAAYQQLVDDPNDLVLAKDEEFLVGIRYHCHQLMTGLPAAVRQRYRALYDAPAGRLYDKAAADGDAAAMREVYSRYRFSSHANRALLWLANRSLDEGRPELARVAYSRLAKEATVTPSTLLRYALAADAAGKPAEAHGVLDRVRKEFGGAPVQVGGKNVTGAQAADQLAASMRRAAPAAASAKCPAFGGESGDRQMKGLLQGGMKPAWEFKHPTSTDTASGTRVIIGGFGRSRLNGYLTFPAVADGKIWIQGPRNLTAVSLADGKPLWDKQDYFTTDAAANLNTGFRRNWSSSTQGSRPFQSAPAVDGNLLVTRLPLMVKGRGDYGPWPADCGIGAVDTRTGELLWRRSAAVGDEKGIYFNLPTLYAGVVLTGVATNKGGITEYSAVALDAGSGEPLWTTYLGAGSDPLFLVDGSPAAVKDGLVWIESSHYTLNALDLMTGEVRLIYHYNPGRRLVFQPGFNSTPQVTNEPVSLVAAGDGPIVFAPRWGTDVIALDPATGKLLWSSPKAPSTSQPTAGSLFAVDQKRAYVCGDYIQAINLTDGAREWTWDPQLSTGSVGFAALAGDRIYVPVAEGIRVFNSADGRPIETLEAGGALGESNVLSSLLVLDDRLVLTTREKVVVFGPK